MKYILTFGIVSFLIGAGMNFSLQESALAQLRQTPKTTENQPKIPVPKSTPELVSPTAEPKKATISIVCKSFIATVSTGTNSGSCLNKEGGASCSDVAGGSFASANCSDGCLATGGPGSCTVAPK